MSAPIFTEEEYFAIFESMRKCVISITRESFVEYVFKKTGQRYAGGPFYRHMDNWIDSKQTKSKTASKSLKALTALLDPHNTALSKFMDTKENYLTSIELISRELGFIPNSLTLFNRYRYAGYWLTVKERQALRTKLILKVEPQARPIWSRQDLIDAAVVACNNNGHRVVPCRKLKEIFGVEFLSKMNPLFKGGILELYGAVKEASPGTHLNPIYITKDGTVLRSDYEVAYYNLMREMFDSMGIKVKIETKARILGRYPDFFLAEFLVIEIMMVNWDDTPTSSKAKKYIKDNLIKKQFYKDNGIKAIFIERKHQHDRIALKAIIEKMIAGPGSNKKVEFTVAICYARDLYTLNEVKERFEPLYLANGHFPTEREAKEAGYYACMRVIRNNFGGRTAVAKKWGWKLKDKSPRAKGHYADFRNVEKDVRSLVVDNIMPSIKALRIFPSTLIEYIYKYPGKVRGVAEKLGLIYIERRGRGKLKY